MCAHGHECVRDLEGSGCVCGLPAVPSSQGGGRRGGGMSEAYRLIMLSRQKGRRLVLPRNVHAQECRNTRTQEHTCRVFFFPHPPPFPLPAKGHGGRTLFKLVCKYIHLDTCIPRSSLWRFIVMGEHFQSSYTHCNVNKRQRHRNKEIFSSICLVPHGKFMHILLVKELVLLDFSHQQ